jgi:hypothetical protein
MIEKKTRSVLVLSVVCGFVVFMSGCAGTHVSEFTYNENYNVNEPVKGEGCYDASVLLSVDMASAKDIAKKVIIALDSTITEETDTSIKAQRNRHIGVFVGSGGEELAVNLKKIDNNKTFISATTKTGFVGGAGQKAWSCKMIDEMVKMVMK